MTNYVIINGVNSNTINGLGINELPPITKPLQRSLIEEIDGRDGDIITKLGYGAYDKTMTIGLFHTYDINEVIAFFNGEGTITFSNEPDKVYYFTILDQIDYEKLINFKTATITLHCQPFKYPINETPIEIAYQYAEGTGETLTLENTADAPMLLGLKGNTQQVILPSEYTQVDYIQSSGTQYIDLNYILKNSNSVELRVKASDNNSSTKMIFGSRAGASDNNFSINITDRVTLDYNNSNYNTYRAVYNYEVDKEYILYISKSKRTIYDGNRNVLVENSTICNDTITTPQNATLFYINPKPSNTWYIPNAKVYTCKIWNDTTLVRDMIPCYRNSDSAVGMYDLVNNVFYTNSGTGTFTYGSLAPTPDTPMQIHTCSGDNTIEICGKNLFDKDNANVLKAYIDSGTNTIVSNNANRVFYIRCLPNTTYTISKVKSATLQAAYTKKLPQIGTDTYGLISQSTISGDYQYITITTGSEAQYLVVRFMQTAQDTKTQDELLSSTQVELGSSMTTYQSYQGNSQLISLGVENLWKNQLTGFLPQSGAYPTTNSTYPNARYILVTLLKGQSITLSGSTSNLGRVRYIDKDTNQVVGMIDSGETEYYISTSPFVAGFTEGTITAKKDFIVGIMDMGGSVNNLIVNYGKLPSYVSDNPIELNKIGTYQDKIYKDNGKWYLHKEIGKVVLDGTQTISVSNWRASETSVGWLYPYNVANNLVPSTNEQLGLVIANKLKEQTYKSMYNKNVDNGISLVDSNTYSFAIRTSDTTLTTNSAINTYLSSNPIEVYYVLATPTNTEITDSTLIETLNSFYSYQEQTNISQENNDLPFTINATALMLGSGEATINNIGNIYSKPTLDIVGNGVVNVSLNGNQIFSVNVSDEIVIDSTNLEAYNPTTHELMNRQVTGNIANLKLDPGENTLTISGDLDTATITNYVRWL